MIKLQIIFDLDHPVEKWFLCTCTPKLSPSTQGRHFSGISGSLEISGNSAEVGEKAQSRGKVREFV